MKRILKIYLFVGFCLLPFIGDAQLLDSVDLAAQPIYTDLQIAIQNPNKVYRLNLKGKKLKFFPNEIFNFKNLQELDLSRNKIDSIPEKIGLLKNLQVLNLGNNKLTYLPDSIGELKKLKKLMCPRNNMDILPKRIGDLENLEVLDLWENNFNSFPIELGKLTKLRWMDLRVILIDDKEQERLRKLLPDTKIFFSPSCHCVTG